MCLCLSIFNRRPTDGVEFSRSELSWSDARDEFLPVTRDHRRLLNYMSTVCKISVCQNNPALRRPVSSRSMEAQVMMETNLPHRKAPVFNLNVVGLKGFRDLPVVAGVEFIY